MLISGEKHDVFVPGSFRWKLVEWNNPEPHSGVFFAKRKAKSNLNFKFSKILSTLGENFAFQKSLIQLISQTKKIASL